MTQAVVSGIGLSIEVKDQRLGDLPAALDEARDLGADIVELPLQEMAVIRGGRIVPDRLRLAARITGERALRYTLHGHLGLNFMVEPPLDRLHWQLFEANLEAAAALHCEHLVIHSGFTPKRQAALVDEAYRRQRDWLMRAAEAARKLGVVVCVENIFEHDGRHTALPRRLAAELAAIDHPNLRATLDVSHAFINATAQGADLLDEIAALAPFAKHLHIHDSFGRPKEFWTIGPVEDLAFGVGDLHLPFGWGTIPWSEIAARARFPAGTIANSELNPLYWAEAREMVAAVRAWAGTLRRTDYALAAE